MNAGERPPLKKQPVNADTLAGQAIIERVSL